MIDVWFYEVYNHIWYLAVPLLAIAWISYVYCYLVDKPVWRSAILWLNLGGGMLILFLYWQNSLPELGLLTFLVTIAWSVLGKIFAHTEKLKQQDEQRCREEQAAREQMPVCCQQERQPHLRLVKND